MEIQDKFKTKTLDNYTQTLSIFTDLHTKLF